MGEANSRENGTIDYWRKKERRKGAPEFWLGDRLERERLAAFGRVHHSHRHLLAFGQMRNAGRT
jgi:hypothetical protein